MRQLVYFAFVYFTFALYDTLDIYLDSIEDPGSCKCSCKNGTTMCTNNKTDICQSFCYNQCLLGEHTLNSDGECKNAFNCTCITIPYMRPVCAKGKTDGVERTFFNQRHVYCLNVCKNNEYEVINYSYCKELRERLKEEKDTNIEIVDNWIRYMEDQTQPVED